MSSAGGELPASPVAPAETRTARAARAWLGPLVLVIAAVGLATAWFLPFTVEGSLADQALGPGGYGLAFWSANPADADFLEAVYFGLAAPIPVLVGLIGVLAVAGVIRAAPGRVQRLGLVVTLVWCLGLAVLFVVVEVGSGLGGDLITLLRGLSPAGLIASLSGAIGAIGAVTRMAGG